MGKSASAPGDGYRTLDGIAVAIAMLLGAHALSAELAWLWRTLYLLVAFP